MMKRTMYHNALNENKTLCIGDAYFIVPYHLSHLYKALFGIIIRPMVLLPTAI